MALRWGHKLVLVVGLCSARALGAPALLLMPAVGTPTQLTVTGLALEDAPSPGSSNLSRNLRRLTAGGLGDVGVQLTFLDTSLWIRADSDGRFEAQFRPKKGEKFPAGGGFVQAKIAGASANVQVQIVSEEAPFLVISDFDDTVAVTEVLKARNFLTNVLLKDSDSHPPVKGMADWYRCMLSEKQAAPALYFLSGSPVRFGPRISHFLRRNKFPFAGLALNDGRLGLAEFKTKTLERILETMPLNVVLVGDSGQRDPEVYRAIGKRFPGRILRTYIRDAGRADDASRFEHMLLFDDAQKAAADAVTLGLASGECVEQKFPGTLTKLQKGEPNSGENSAKASAPIPSTAAPTQAPASVDGGEVPAQDQDKSAGEL